MVVRIASVSMETFLYCIKLNLWGTNSNFLYKWHIGDKLIFKVENKLMAVASVAGEAYLDDKEVWPNGLFWNRLPLSFDIVLKEEDAVDFNSDIKDLFLKEWGKKYGWVILNKYPLPTEIGNALLNVFVNKNNNNQYYKTNIDKLISQL
jgi:hypothetical protein